MGDHEVARIWPGEGAEEPLTLERHCLVHGESVHVDEELFRPVHVAPDGRHFAIGASDGTLRVTPLVGDPATVTLRYRPPGATSVSCAACGVDGGLATIVLRDGTVYRASVAAGAELREPARAGTAPMALAAVSDDARTVALTVDGDASFAVRVLALDGGDDAVLLGAAARLDALAVSRDGRCVAATERGRGVLVWRRDAAGWGAPRALLRGGTWGGDTLRPATRVLALGADGADGAAILESDSGASLVDLRAVDDADGEMPTTMLSAASVVSLAVACDGRWLVECREDGKVTCYAEAATSVHLDVAQHGIPSQLAVSEDGRWFAVVMNDGTAELRRTDGAGVPLALTVALEQVERVAFTPDGRRVIVRDVDGVVRVWSVAWDDLVRRVRAAATRAWPPTPMQEL